MQDILFHFVPHYITYPDWLSRNLCYAVFKIIHCPHFTLPKWNIMAKIWKIIFYRFWWTKLSFTMVNAGKLIMFVLILIMLMCLLLFLFQCLQKIKTSYSLVILLTSCLLIMWVHFIAAYKIICHLNFS